MMPSPIDYLLGGLDAPGAMVRSGVGELVGAQATGDNAFLGATPTGRDILEALGVLGANEEGLDFGDVLGFGADVLLSPPGLGAAGYGAAKAGKAAIGAGKAAMQNADDFARAAGRIRGGMDDVAGLGHIQKGHRSDDLMELLGDTARPQPTAPSLPTMSRHFDDLERGGIAGTVDYMPPEVPTLAGRQVPGPGLEEVDNFLKSVMSRQPRGPVEYENVLSEIKHVNPFTGTKVFPPAGASSGFNLQPGGSNIRL